MFLSIDAMDLYFFALELFVYEMGAIFFIEIVSYIFHLNISWIEYLQ